MFTYFYSLNIGIYIDAKQVYIGPDREFAHSPMARNFVRDTACFLYAVNQNENMSYTVLSSCVLILVSLFSQYCEMFEIKNQCTEILVYYPHKSAM